MELQDNEQCFVCGKDNPVGLRVDFAVDAAAKTIGGRFVPRPEHQGYAGIIHGGIIAALLDEAMVKLAWRIGIPAVTAEITTKFKAPAAPGDDLVVTASIIREHGRLIEAESKVERGPVVIGEAKGKLLKVR
jgi:acyl-coenzyme A thioesterase PaaI-like protein